MANVDTLTVQKHQELQAHIAAFGEAPDVIALMETRPKTTKGDWNQALFSIPG
jgi:hypothetical protein